MNPCSQMVLLRANPCTGPMRAYLQPLTEAKPKPRRPPYMGHGLRPAGPGQQKRLDVNLITLGKGKSDVSRMAGTLSGELS
jgi:hypothetical protein